MIFVKVYMKAKPFQFDLFSSICQFQILVSVFLGANSCEKKGKKQVYILQSEVAFVLWYYDESRIFAYTSITTLQLFNILHHQEKKEINFFSLAVAFVFVCDEGVIYAGIISRVIHMSLRIFLLRWVLWYGKDNHCTIWERRVVYVAMVWKML